MLKHGIQAAAYPAIVGSGPMGNQWHYEDSGRQMKAGELVVMDYGGSLDYLTIDITRTWPVSAGSPTRSARRIRRRSTRRRRSSRAIKPGVARDVVRKIAEDIFRKHGFDPRYAYIGHYVGLSVHDVGDWNLPFEAGMVMAIEPIIDMPDQQMHIRDRGHDPGDADRRGDPERRPAEGSRRAAGADQALERRESAGRLRLRIQTHHATFATPARAHESSTSSVEPALPTATDRGRRRPI